MFYSCLFSLFYFVLEQNQLLRLHLTFKPFFYVIELRFVLKGQLYFFYYSNVIYQMIICLHVCK